MDKEKYAQFASDFEKTKLEQIDKDLNDAQLRKETFYKELNILEETI